MGKLTGAGLVPRLQTGEAGQAQRIGSNATCAIVIVNCGLPDDPAALQLILHAALAEIERLRRRSVDPDVLINISLQKDP